MEPSTAITCDAPPLAVSGEAVSVRRPLLTRRRVVRAAVVVVVAGLAGGLVSLQSWPPFATVMSASMAPTIETGDIVVMKRIDGAPRVGDVVSVSVPAEARSRYGYPPTVIHRVVAVRPDGQVTTKGDARREPDPFTVPAKAVDTKVVATVPAAGRVLSFLGSTLGLVWLAAGVLLLVVLPLVERQRESQRRSQDGMEEIREALAQLPELIQAEIRRAMEAAQPAPPPTEPPPPPPEPEPPVPYSVVPAQSGLFGSIARRSRGRTRRN